MPRPQRICMPDLTYHVYSRCIERRSIMKDHHLKELLVRIMDRTADRYRFKLISYQIMDNHFHFIIKTVKGGESISRIMQYLKARFAEAYNKRTGRTGPFWNERFKDRIVERSEDPTTYMLVLLWYMAFNPVRKRIVKNPRHYKYGSINTYLDENYRSPLHITHHECFLSLGSTFKERVKRFLLYEDFYLQKQPFYT